MATTNGDERLAEMIREYEQQDEQWARAHAKMAALGDVEIHVRPELLTELDEACMVRGSSTNNDVMGIRA